MSEVKGRKGVTIRELSQGEVQEAILTGYCPFCKDESKSFTCLVSAIQEFCLDDEGKIEWDNCESLDDIGNVECVDCGQDIPKEIYLGWLNKKRF